MEMEARHWFSRPRDGQVLILISSGGVRTWEESRDYLLPPTLAKNLKAEPLWISLQHRRERMLANPDDPQLRGEVTEDLKQLLLRFYPDYDWDQLRGQERVERQRAKWLVSGVILILLIFLGFAVHFWWSAGKQRDKARTQLLAMQARRVGSEAQWPDEIGLAGALALESIWAARKANLPVESDAVEGVGSTLMGLPSVVLTHGIQLVSSVAQFGDGRLASVGPDDRIKLWHQDGSQEPEILLHGSKVAFVAGQPYEQLASGGRDGTIKLWPKDGRGKPVVLRHGTDMLSLTMMFDGRLASGSRNGTIKLWPKNGRGKLEVWQHGSDVLSLAGLFDGRLASGSDEGTIKLWPADGRGEPVLLAHGYGEVAFLAVLADGRLASDGRDGTIKLWQVDEQKLITALCFRTGRNIDKDEWIRYIGADSSWQPSCRDLPSHWRTPD